MDTVSEAESNPHIQMDRQLSTLSSPGGTGSRSRREEEQEARKLRGDGSCQGETFENAGPWGCVEEGTTPLFSGQEVTPLVILSEAAWNPSGSRKEQPFEEVLMESQTAKPKTDAPSGQLPHVDTTVLARLPETGPKLTQTATKSKTSQGDGAEAVGRRPGQAYPTSSAVQSLIEPVQNAHQAQNRTQNPNREAVESTSGERQQEGCITGMEQVEERTGVAGGREKLSLQVEQASAGTVVKPLSKDHTETPKNRKSPLHESHGKGATPESQQSQRTPAEASQNPEPPSAEKQGAWEHQHLQFKEVATMTTSTEWGPTPKRKCQDAEVQTTADVCSKSTATSPLFFLASVCQQSCQAKDEDTEILTVLSPPDCGMLQRACGEAFSSRCGHVSVTDPQMFARCQVHMDPAELPDHQKIKQVLQQVRLEAGACQSMQAGAFYPATSGLCCGMEAAADTGRPPLHSSFAPLQPVYQINIQPNRIPETGICRKGSSPTTSLPRQPRSEHSNGNHAANLREGLVPECLPPLEPPGPRDPLPSTKGSGSKKTKLQFVLENDQTLVSKNTKNTEHEADPQDSWAFGLDHYQETALSKPGTLSRQPRSLEEDEEEYREQGSTVQKQSDCEPVQDVVWDEQGMTWEVYGASLDPESLGFAIQSHLQSKIREQERKVRAIRKSICSESSQGKRGGRKSRNVFRILLKSVRRPACCGRPQPSAVLD